MVTWYNLHVYFTEVKPGSHIKHFYNVKSCCKQSFSSLSQINQSSRLNLRERGRSRMLQRQIYVTKQQEFIENHSYLTICRRVTFLEHKTWHKDDSERRNMAKNHDIGQRIQPKISCRFKPVLFPSRPRSNEVPFLSYTRVPNS